MERIWVIGGGHFGTLAVSRIHRNFPGARITVVDNAKPDAPLLGVTRIVADGASWLNRMLTETAPVDVIVPAAPIHLALLWMTYRLRGDCQTHRIPIDKNWLSGMPNPMTGLPGQVFVSHADFFCPDNCPEPAGHCTVTGKPRPTNLFDLLCRLAPAGILPVVLRSHQLLAGVGGLFPEDLFEALETVRRHTGQPLMVATACRCHGVVDFVRLVRKDHSDPNRP